MKCFFRLRINGKLMVAQKGMRDKNLRIESILQKIVAPFSIAYYNDIYELDKLLKYRIAWKMIEVLKNFHYYLFY